MEKDLPGIAVHAEHAYGFASPVDVEGVVAVERVGVLVSFQIVSNVALQVGLGRLDCLSWGDGHLC